MYYQQISEVRSILKVGIDTWIYHPALSIEEILEKIKSHGFNYIEYAYEHFKTTKEPEKQLKRLIDISTSYDLKPIQIHAPYGNEEYQLGAEDEGLRKCALKKMTKWLEYASMLNCEVYVIHVAMSKFSLNRSSIETFEKLVKRNLDYIRRLARVANDLGIKIAVENPLQKTFGATVTDLIYLNKYTEPEIVGVCLDMGHAFLHGFDINSMIRELGNIIIATHVHDNDGRSDRHWPPGMGCIDWKSVLEALKSIGYDKPLILEVAGSEDLRMCENRIHLIKAWLEYMKLEL